MKELLTIDKLVFHHTAVEINGRTNIQYRDDVRKSHVNHRKFADIGYHLMVFPNGDVLQCRSMQYQGAHTKGHNHNTIGIAFAGNMSIHGPTREQIKSAIAVSVSLCRCFGLGPSDSFGHGELTKTECPGKFIEMDYIRKMIGVKLNARRDQTVS